MFLYKKGGCMKKNNFFVFVLVPALLLSGVHFEMKGAEQSSYWSLSGLRSALASMVPSSWGVPDWAMSFVSRLGEYKIHAIFGAIVAYLGIGPVKMMLKDYEQKQKNDELRRKQIEEASLYFHGEPLSASESESESEKKLAQKIAEIEEAQQRKEQTEGSRELRKAYQEKLEREKQTSKQRKGAREAQESMDVLGSAQKTYKTYGKHKARLAQEKERSDNPLLYAQPAPESESTVAEEIRENIQQQEEQQKSRM
jgi:hypothetical protein